jgi:hypothetical protein
MTVKSALILEAYTGFMILTVSLPMVMICIQIYAWGLPILTVFIL